MRGEAFRLLREFRGRASRGDGAVSKEVIWVGFDRTLEERDRIRPIGSLYGLCIDALKLAGDGALDVEAIWKVGEEKVQVTRDSWATSFVLLQRVDGELKSAPVDEWKAYMRNSKLEQMLSMAEGERDAAMLDGKDTENGRFRPGAETYQRAGATTHDMGPRQDSSSHHRSQDTTRTTKYSCLATTQAHEARTASATSGPDTGMATHRRKRATHRQTT